MGKLLAATTPLKNHHFFWKPLIANSSSPWEAPYRSLSYPHWNILTGWSCAGNNSCYKHGHVTSWAQHFIAQLPILQLVYHFHSLFQNVLWAFGAEGERPDIKDKIRNAKPLTFWVVKTNMDMQTVLESGKSLEEISQVLRSKETGHPPC